MESTLSAAGMLRMSQERGECHYLTTDNRERFSAMGSRFLGAALQDENVELVDL